MNAVMTVDGVNCGDWQPG